MTLLFAVAPNGIALIALTVIALAAASFGYWILARRGPRLAVLIVGFGLLIASVIYEPRPDIKLVNGNLVPEYSGPLLFLDGLLNLSGLLGILLGFLVLVRRKPKADSTPPTPLSKAVEMKT